MFLQIELLYFVLMIATFIALVLAAKMPSGLSLMISAIVGAVFSSIISKTPFELRYFVEGAFGYFDTILVITAAMIFMGAMQVSGALEYISALLVRTFRRVPALLLISFMIIIMFPAMVTGSSLASAISAGALVAPIMIKWGIPKSKTGAIVALGSVLGMVAPPVNVPAMVICDVVDIPYTGFTLPLLLLAFPLAIVGVLLIGRKYVKPLSKEEVDCVVDTSVLKELNWTVCIPVIVLIALIICEIIWPKIFGSLAMPAMFLIATIISFFVGRKLPFWVSPKKRKAKAEEEGITVDEYKERIDKNEKPDSVVGVFSQGVHKSFSAMGLLMGVGMFMEVIASNGVRGFFVINAISLPNAWKYVGMALTLPIFGGVSAFGSASILGGPFVMALNGIADNIIVTAGLSLLAAVGEFLPPTAMSASFAANIVGEKKWSKITKAALPALLVMYVYGIIFVLAFGKAVQMKSMGANTTLYLFLIMIAIAILFAVIWEVLVRKVRFFSKCAYQVGTESTPFGVEGENAASENVEEAVERIADESPLAVTDEKTDENADTPAPAVSEEEVSPDDEGADNNDNTDKEDK